MNTRPNVVVWVQDRVMKARSRDSCWNLRMSLGAVQYVRERRTEVWCLQLAYRSWEACG